MSDQNTDNDPKPLDMDAIRARAEAALTAICAVAARGDRAFRMSIPPQEDDTDMLVSGVCDDVRALVAEVERLTTENKRLENQVAEVHTYTFCAGHETTGCTNPVRASRVPLGLCRDCAAAEILRLRAEATVPVERGA